MSYVGCLGAVSKGLGSVVSDFHAKFLCQSAGARIREEAVTGHTLEQADAVYPGAGEAGEKMAVKPLEVAGIVEAGNGVCDLVLGSR